MRRTKNGPIELAKRANIAWNVMVKRINHLAHVHEHDIHGALEIHEALMDAEEAVRGVRLVVEEGLRERGNLRRGKAKLRLVRSAKEPGKSTSEKMKELATLVRENKDVVVAGLQKNRRLERRLPKKARISKYDRATGHALFEMRQYREWICDCADCSFIRADLRRTGDLCPTCGCPPSEEAPQGCGAHLV